MSFAWISVKTSEETSVVASQASVVKVTLEVSVVSVASAVVVQQTELDPS